ncbi:MAG: DinB family protein [Acidimicrobiales bacterium]
MPGLVPPVADEREALLAFLSQQRDALRYAAHGLSVEQASDRPTVSELCLAGLIKHAGLVERAWTTFLVSGDTGVFVPADDWADGFRLVGTETLDDVIALADGQARDTEKVVRDLPDLGAPLPPTADLVPWIPGGTVWTPRWVLLHLIEETARHAGHADIIRESIDGAGCWTVMAAAEGWPEQDWG